MMMEEKEKISVEEKKSEDLTAVTFEELEIIEEIYTGSPSGILGCVCWN
ncbi:hypothetical protein [Thermoanaerobacter sp. A7A]|nr:hypothetical protein [Thermoanaerobacter sp. A7A]